MPIVILSPYSGRPVKVRDQDISRAVRDEEGCIFYVLQKGDGSGYYASPTRAGGPKEQARYAELEQKVVQSEGQSRGQQKADLHDATGKRRSNLRGKLVLLVLLLIALAVAGVLWKLADGWTGGTPAAPLPPSQTAPQEAPEAPPAQLPLEPAA